MVGKDKDIKLACGVCGRHQFLRRKSMISTSFIGSRKRAVGQLLTNLRVPSKAFYLMECVNCGHIEMFTADSNLGYAGKGKDSKSNVMRASSVITQEDKGTYTANLNTFNTEILKEAVKVLGNPTLKEIERDTVGLKKIYQVLTPDQIKSMLITNILATGDKGKIENVIKKAEELAQAAAQAAAQTAGEERELQEQLAALENVDPLQQQQEQELFARLAAVEGHDQEIVKLREQVAAARGQPAAQTPPAVVANIS
jgi:predicted nucleic-acid-binding Zn-ribbon protein